MAKHALSWLAAVAVLACSREPGTPAGAESAAIGPSTPTPTPTSTATPEPGLPAPVSRATVVEQSGPAPLARDGDTVVDPASSFEVELSERVGDVRLVLLDAADAHVASKGTREVGASTRLVLEPAAPLVPGSRYALRLEGETGRELHGADGRAYAPLSFTLLAAGTPPPPEPKKKPKAKRRRR